MKYQAGPTFMKGDHLSHPFDLIGTCDTNCPTCLALWDARVHQLAVLFSVQLQKDCPELGEGLRLKVMAAWFKTVAMEGK